MSAFWLIHVFLGVPTLTSAKRNVAKHLYDFSMSGRAACTFSFEFVLWNHASLLRYNFKSLTILATFSPFLFQNWTQNLPHFGSV